MLPGDRRRVSPFRGGFSVQPGSGGNPPVEVPAPKRKVPLDLKSLARSYTEAAVQTLGGIAAKGESEAARVQACSILLDRGWGKAEQKHTGDVNGDLRITIRQIIDDRRQPKIIEGKVNGDKSD